MLGRHPSELVGRYVSLARRRELRGKGFGLARFTAGARPPGHHAQKYVLLYEPVPICRSRLSPTVKVMNLKSLGGASRAGLPASLGTLHAGWRALFVVERRLPGITDRDLAMLQAALLQSAARFTARGEQVTYVRSIFLPDQHRLLSLFSGVSLELVRAANEASLVPYVGIQRAIDLPDPSEFQGE